MCVRVGAFPPLCAFSMNSKLSGGNYSCRFNFYDIFHRIEEISYQQGYGVLTKPDNIGVFPLIIGVAGSAGWDEHHYGYLERYVQNGFAVFYK